MSSSRLKVLSAPALALALAGCFHPLYGGIGGAKLAADLQAIAVDPIPDRLGHYLGDELIFALNGTGEKVPPRYRLLVTTTERVQTPLIDNGVTRASSNTVIVDANFRLIPAGGGAPIVTGIATGIAVYDRSEQRYANIRAARDAEIRDAKVLAQQISTRVAIALAPKD